MRYFFIIFATIFLTLTSSYAKTGDVHKLNWNGLDVVWLEDNRFPTYDMYVYFADGALSDSKNEKGTTAMMFNLLESGTRRYSEKEISDNLEYFGASYGGTVYHEYSTYSISGLVKDILPTVKKICHVFDDARFPVREIRRAKKRAASSIRSIVNNHDSLGALAFRELSLKGSPYSYPVSGKIHDIKKMLKKTLEKKHKYFQNHVYKRIYITGPKKALSIKKALINDCHWGKQKGKFVRDIKYSKAASQKRANIYLVPVPKANQAQVLVGRFLNQTELNNIELKNLSSSYLTSGFLSKLMQELRVKRGLTYTVDSFISVQKQYGRAGITTSTKNKSIKETIEVIKASLEQVGKNDIPAQDFKKIKSSMSGSYPFRFEKSSAYLYQLLYFDHIGKGYDRIYRYPQIINKYSPKDVAQTVGDAFNWNDLSIVVIGNKSLKGQLKDFGDVKVLKYKGFL